MAAGNAIFTEVLQIGIDTSMFAAEMKKVEQIYANSIKNMPQLGAMGTQLATAGFQKAASDIANAAQSIEARVFQMSTNVEKSMTSMAATVQAASAKAAASAKTTSSSLKAPMTTMERFGNALETAFIRIPARMAAIAALGVVVGAAAVPFKLLADGFENLGKQTPEFKEVRTQLADTFSILESVAAKPIFDLILTEMKELAKWLNENKQFVSQLAFAFGEMAAAFVNAVVGFAKLDLVKEGFKGLGLVFISTVSSVTTLVNEIKLLLGVLDNVANSGQKTKNVFTSDKGIWGQLKENFQIQTTNGGSNDPFKQFDSDEMRNARATVDAAQALSGKSDGTDHSKGILAESQLKTSQEIMTKYRQDLSDLKLDHKKAMDEISEQENRQVINKETAKGKIVAAVAEERKAIDGLVEKYRALLTTATDITQLDGSTMRQKTDMLLLGGRGSNAASPYSAGEAEVKSATQAADKEAMAAKEKALTELKALVEKSYAADVALDKKAESEKQATHVATVHDEMALEEERHRQIVALNAQMPDGAVDMPNYLAKQKAAADEEETHNNRVIASKQALTQATREDIAVNLQYSEGMAKVQIEQLKAADAEATSLGNKRSHLELTKKIIEAELQLADAEVKAAQNKLAGDKGPAADADRVLIASLFAQIDRLKQALSNTNYSGTALGKFENAEDQGKGSSATDKLSESLHLDEAAKDWNNANSGVEKFGAVVEGATSIVNALSGAIGEAIAGYKKAGAMGAAGALLSNQKVSNAIGAGADAASGMGGAIGGAMDSLGNMMPMIGPLIGGMFQAITGLFQQGIQTMVDNINNQIQSINQQAQLKQIGIQQQIAELKAEEQAAIQQLGGKKKAQSQLDSILKSLNSEIAQLQFQAAQTVQQFNDMVNAASLGNMSGVMASWASTWTQINQQVEQYIQAGGSMATAAQYLNQQLKQQTQQLQDQVNQGNQTAIGDALNLNKLLTQRVDMMKQEAATEFGLLNSDSAERRTSSAVQLGTELTKQRAQYAQQLLDLNNQISLGQQKVAIESKIFDINKSVAALQAASNALTISSLNEQLAKYQDMQSLLKATAGLVFTPGSINPGAGLNGTQAGIPGEPTVAGNINFAPGAIVVQGDVTSANAKSLAGQIATNIRSGRTTFSA